jgi:hypothetical protein
MLPLCRQCNNAKKDFAPGSIQTGLAESFLIEENARGDFTGYEKSEVLRNVTDRLVEPSLDEPDDHIEFSPTIGRYLGKSEIGNVTANKIFKRHEVFEKSVQTISDFIHNMLTEPDVYPNPRQTLDDLITVKNEGYSFITEKIYSYWVEQIKN